MSSLPAAVLRRTTDRFRLPPDDLLRDRAYRRLWSSILISSFGNQISMLALPLTAALLLQATPTQMGLLTAMEIAPFVLFSLPAGVWLDRVRKLPVYIGGELLLAAALLTVPIAWWLGWLSMTWLYVVGFALGTVHTIAGSAAQIVLTQIVPRERLVEAHAKNALANSSAEVMGPGVAGALIKLVGAPIALLADALLLAFSAFILRGIQVTEGARTAVAQFWPALRQGLQFVTTHRLLVTMAITVGIWQMAHYAALTVQILFATRVLGLNEGAVGACFIALGVGTILTSLVGSRISARIGPGPTMVLGFAITGSGWTLAALAPASAFGVAVFAAMLMLFGIGAVLIFIAFLALRQAVTPAPLLGRMTSTMRWLTLLPAGPGALLSGWLGEHLGLRVAMGFAGASALLLAAIAWRVAIIRDTRVLPTPPPHNDLATADEALEALRPLDDPAPGR
ncbi:MAG: MFS transporter [Burkholderiaceae bacterium]|nr:MFS transporter [Burkholderiaceae bacterium]